MTTAAGTDTSKSDTKASSNSKTNASTSNNDEDSTVTVRLLARQWQRRVPGSDPVAFKTFWRGAEFDITEEEYDLLIANTLKPVIVKVEDENTDNSSTTTTTTS